MTLRSLELHTIPARRTDLVLALDRKVSGKVVVVSTCSKFLVVSQKSYSHWLTSMSSTAAAITFLLPPIRSIRGQPS